MLDDLSGDISEIPLKQRRISPQPLLQYEQEAIINAYCSGGYTQKQIGDFFGLHYSQISRIVAKYKT